MRLLRVVILFIVFHLSFTVSGQTDEYLLKAGLIEKFAKFTKWPDSGAGSEFVISVIGTSPFGKSLDVYYKSKKLKGKKVVVRYISSVSEIEKSNVLFICSSEAYRLNKILAVTADRPVLTIGEYTGFAKSGVLINFYQTPKSTIHFEMNPGAVKESSLKIDVMLMNYAKKVE